MKIVTAEQIREYILAQNPERTVDMNNPYLPTPEKAGCLLTQYGIDNGFDFNYTTVGLFAGWHKTVEDRNYSLNSDAKSVNISMESDTWWEGIFGSSWADLNGKKTFGDLQELLIKN